MRAGGACQSKDSRAIVFSRDARVGDGLSIYLIFNLDRVSDFEVYEFSFNSVYINFTGLLIVTFHPFKRGYF